MADADDTLMLAILKDIRKDLQTHQTLLLQLVEGQQRQSRRSDDLEQRHSRRFDALEHRITDAAADLELMLKGELLGRLTHFESQTDNRIAELEERLKSRS